MVRDTEGAAVGETALLMALSWGAEACETGAAGAVRVRSVLFDSALLFGRGGEGLVRASLSLRAPQKK